MRRLSITPVILLASLAGSGSALAQTRVNPSENTLAGAREIGIFGTGRLLSTEYSADEGKTAFGAAATFATHLKSTVAVQGGLAMNYSRQGYSFYRPPLLIITPTVSLILQRSTAADVQPYGIIGAGYEFIRYTHPRCDCNQSRSLGVGNAGVGVRKMIGDTRAYRFEVSSQIGKGGPAFTVMAGLSVFVGGSGTFPIGKGMRVRDRKTEPPLVPIPKTSTTISPATRPAAPAPAPAPAPSTPARPLAVSPLPAGVGAVFLKIDGTQVNFAKTAWLDDAEPLLDGLIVDLISDAGQRIKVNIEAHTDNIGSNAANIMVGLDRARAVRDYLVSQGVAPDRVRVSSSGEDAPIAPNTTALGRQQNRRIIIKRDN